MIQKSNGEVLFILTNSEDSICHLNMELTLQ